MAYVDQQMSGNRIVAIILVALIHLAVGYALVTGLAYSAMQKVVERVTTVDIEEPPPEEEPPPPEEIPETQPPPPVAPPPPISIAPSPPQIQTQPTIPPPAPLAVRVPPPAPVAPPPPPPPPRVQPKVPTPKGAPGNWANSNDYPSRALREEKEGVTRFSVQVDASGRVSNCSVTGSSGTPELDTTTCSLITRRGRFNPATDGDGKPTGGSWSSSVRWQIPK